ncbi:hypothetical protein AB0L56_10980 [Streptomyces sp. NPDC052079]|uniref:hypothetical protein n=1 Tax=Streptomyces sp. NPDC052079 TaxID=3155526 RepID=UPI0034459085
MHLTQEQNAEKLTKLAAVMYKTGELTKRTSVSPRQFRRWESDAPPWPHPDHRKLLERFYDRPIHELGFSPTGDTAPSTLAVTEPVPSVIRTEFETHDPVNRRQLFATGAAALGSAAGAGLPWLSPTASAAPGDDELRVSHDDVENLRSAAHDLDALDQQFGSDRLWRGARNQLLWLHHLIDHGTYSEPVGQELHAIAGQLTTSLGWFCYDADRQTEARVFFSEALNTAMLDGDDALATRTLSNMARQSVDLGKAREAIRFSRIAQAHATEWSAPPRVAALLAIREAQGHARLGDEISAGNAIKRPGTTSNTAPASAIPTGPASSTRPNSPVWKACAASTSDSTGSPSNSWTAQRNSRTSHAPATAACAWPASLTPPSKATTSTTASTRSTSPCS